MATIKIDDNEIKIFNRFGKPLSYLLLKQFTTLIPAFAQIAAKHIILEGKDLNIDGGSSTADIEIELFLQGLAAELSQQLSGKEAMVLRNIFLKDLNPMHQIEFCKNLKGIKFATYVYFNDAHPIAAAYLIKQNQFTKLVRVNLENFELNQGNIKPVLEIISSRNVQDCQILYKHSSVDVIAQIASKINAVNGLNRNVNIQCDSFEDLREVINEIKTKFLTANFNVNIPYTNIDNYHYLLQKTLHENRQLTELTKTNALSGFRMFVDKYPHRESDVIEHLKYHDITFEDLKKLHDAMNPKEDFSKMEEMVTKDEIYIKYFLNELDNNPECTIVQKYQNYLRSSKNQVFQDVFTEMHLKNTIRNFFCRAIQEKASKESLDHLSNKSNHSIPKFVEFVEKVLSSSIKEFQKHVDEFIRSPSTTPEIKWQNTFAIKYAQNTFDQGVDKFLHQANSHHQGKESESKESESNDYNNDYNKDCEGKVVEPTTTTLYQN